jgi:hypothetical protein
MLIIRTDNLIIECSILSLESSNEGYHIYGLQKAGGEKVLLGEYNTKKEALNLLNRMYTCIRTRQRCFNISSFI